MNKLYDKKEANSIAFVLRKKTISSVGGLKRTS
jgi:hypothetical protein